MNTRLVTVWGLTVWGNSFVYKTITHSYRQNMQANYETPPKDTRV